MTAKANAGAAEANKRAEKARLEQEKLTMQLAPRHLSKKQYNIIVET